MKRKLLFALTALSIAFFLNVSQSNAQTAVGGQLAFGTEGDLGIGALGEFYVSNEISITPGIMFFFPDFFNWFEINVNGNYHFETGSSVTPYALAGLNMVFLSLDSDLGDASDSFFGVNLGGGANFDIGSQWTPFAELRFVISDADQFVIGGGVKYTIN